MNEIRKVMITTLEVAEMMGIEHKEILRKLEGTKKPDGSVKQIGILPVLTRGNFPLSDYFVESTYRDSSGKENKCYQATKLGCDLLANKFNGEKGILFTAKYVKRFYELEHELEHGNSISYQYPLPAATFDGAANLGRLIERVMKSEGACPHEIAVVLKPIFQQAGIEIQNCFVKIPAYEQYTLDIVTR